MFGQVQQTFTAGIAPGGTMRRISRFQGLLPLLTVVILMACQSAWSQATTGSIVGTVSDPSKAMIQGAQVAAQNELTGVTYPGESDNQGNYSVYGLMPGPYSVVVKKEGFATATIKNVVIAIDQKQLLNFELKVGSTTTVVAVNTAPTLLQTQSSETGDVIRSNDVLDLPLLGRHFYDLTALTAGVVSNNNMNTFGFQVNGQREYANSIQVDGVESTSNRTQDITVTPSVDAVEEFKVSTSAFSAEFGKSAGADVSIQTKAGSNQWHGDLYEFFRPNFTTAKNYGFLGIKTPPSVLKQHNYGGTFGGPIKHDKTFFFVSYEGTHENSANDGVFNTLPGVCSPGVTFTGCQINVLADGSVDLSKLIDPLAGHYGVPAGQVVPIFDPAISFNSYGGSSQQFAGNIIPASEVSKAGLNTVLNFFAQPNLPGSLNGWFNNFQFHYPTTFRQKQADARLDHNFSQKDRLSAVSHYNDSQILDLNIYYGHTVVPGADDTDFANKQDSAAQSYSVSEMHLFSSRFLNEARFGYTRYSINQYSLLNGHDYSTQYGWGNIGIPGFPATDAYPYIQLYSGYFTGGSSYKPLLLQDHNLQFTDNLILSSIGKHELKFGGDFRRLNAFPFFTIFPTGYQYYGAYYSPSTSDPTYGYFNPYAWFPNGGSDISDLLTGLPYVTYIGLQLTNPHTQSWEMNYYVQDTYKVNQKLTLNYGVRYEYQAPYKDANNNASNYDPNTQSFLLASRGSNSAALINSRWTNFSPRLGFAFQVRPKTVLRGGFGLFYTPENDGREDILARNYPFSNLKQYLNYYYYGPPSYSNDTGVPRNTSLNIPSGASSIPSASIPDAQGPLLTSYYINPNMKTGYSSNYNLSVQQQLGADFAFDLAYVGSRGRRLSYQVGNINFDPVTQQNGRLDPNLGKIQGMTDAGLSGYNSFQGKLTKRVSHNLNFLATYTWSHSIDNGPSPFNLGQNNNYPQSAYNLREEIASSDTDVRHNFTFSGLYRLPVGRGQRFFGDWGKMPEFLLGGWQLNGIIYLRTGTPVNVVSVASVYTPCPGIRPNLVGDPNGPPPQAPAGSPPYYFNVAAFNVPAGQGCTPGTAGRNLVRGPAYQSLDASIFKEFGFAERYKLQTRLELFNATNTPHFGNPDGSYSDGTFGQLTAPYGNMRVVQLAAKFIF
jgi:outer membrane receptor protein involved in Fe transport